jgi:hypothetical protein
MRGAGASEEHIKAVRDNGQSKRIRPEEVVGATVTDIDEWAISYDRAQELAAEILADMAVVA